MNIPMQSTKILETQSYDLRKMLEDTSIDTWTKIAIRTELEIRLIIHTSASDGVAHVTWLEKSSNADDLYKMKALAEAEHREECGLERQTLIKKIRSTLARLERKTGLGMVHTAYDEYSTAPWKPTEDYNPKKHAPRHQHQIKGVPIDPRLPFWFDNTDNNERDDDEVQDWWGRAYVVSSRNRITGKVSYNVRCLDGGAWDRSTWRGNYSNLMEAIDHAYGITQVVRKIAA